MQPQHRSWESIRRELDGAYAESGRAARAQLAHDLNQLLRRLRQYQTEAEWVNILLDAASRFAQQAAVFRLKNGIASLGGQANLAVSPDLSFPIKSAAAFACAADSKDPVTALRTPGEVSEALSTSDPDDRAQIFAIGNAGRTVALLFAADASGMDANALELIAGIASLVLERQSNSSLHSQIALTPSRRPQRSGLPSWTGLGEDRPVHIRAQRFSRVSVAEMQLARPEACRAGREQSNLYLFLKSEIDRARETFRSRFLTIPSMIDYLHLELVHTAAEGDEKKLGADYPGQLV
jgi:hypothetical protein